jgi:hypothetical protein
MASTCDPGPIFSLLPPQDPGADQRYFDPLKPTLSPQPNWLSPLSTYFDPWNGPIVAPAPTVPSVNPDISQLFAGATLHPQTGITEAQFQGIADQLKIEVAVVEAFAQVETGKAPFDSLGRPTILYERHYFYRATRGKYAVTHPHICNSLPYHRNPRKKRQPKHKKGTPAAPPAAPFNPVQANANDDYYGDEAIQYPRLKEAYDLDSPAALESASWGRFQVMGANFMKCGYSTVQAFVLTMMRSEYAHLEAFAGYVRHTTGLQAACQKKDWNAMAVLYNGSDDAKNKKIKRKDWKNPVYAKKLADAYAALTKTK